MSIDSLLAHCKACVDETIVAYEPPHPTPSKSPLDVIALYVTATAEVRGRDRADALLAALARGRHLAVSRHSPLSMELLSHLQSIVLGCSVSFRRGPAYAKDGRERYGHFDDLQLVFEQRLQRVQTENVSPIKQAALVYLDICFFHPFPDGNGRLALIAADYLLCANALQLNDVRFVLPISAGNLADYLRFLDIFGRSVRLLRRY